jgi:hypothetical protein
VLFWLNFVCDNLVHPCNTPQRGPGPKLSDVEVLTMEIFGEQQGRHDDAFQVRKIWMWAVIVYSFTAVRKAGGPAKRVPAEMAVSRNQAGNDNRSLLLCSLLGY